ncbi:MAG: AMP-binding protein [Thermomonas sp.]|uniref:class I adenylate-forming enzyme family protein n=1 Tax=Thermomonas sp. TaxID=1971895 RepID=UPI0039E47047
MPSAQPYFPDIISLNGRWLAGKPALVSARRTLSWRALNEEANRVANGLIAAGCGKGERIGVVMDNSADMLSAMFGAMKAGAVVVPVNTSIADEAVNILLADAGVAAVFASQNHVARIGDDVRRACRLLVFDGARDAAPTGWQVLASWRDSQPSHDPCVAVDADDPCNIIYSSGTTGQPKGIVHTHGIRIDWAHDVALVLRHDSAARTLVATGLYSNITWASLLCTTLVGGTLVLTEKFDAAETLEIIERERTTHTAMVPVQYQRLLEHPDFARRDTSSMRSLMSVGSALPERIKHELLERFPGAVIELYGTTEGALTALAPEQAAGRVASVGKPLPGSDLCILGDDNVPVPPGEQGEIVMRTRFSMAGYWRNAQATAEAWWIDGQGRTWLRTGDIGRLDDEGFLTITDRKKDVIISGGQNLYPADLEAVLMQHRQVSDCAVIGVPSERWGEAPLALVVFAQGATIDERELLDWANARVGKQQRLSAIERRDALPRNANGKLLKRELRAPYWGK